MQRGCILQLENIENFIYFPNSLPLPPTVLELFPGLFFFNKCSMKMLKILAQVCPKTSVTVICFYFHFWSFRSAWTMAWTILSTLQRTNFCCSEILTSQLWFHGTLWTCFLTDSIKFVGFVLTCDVSLLFVSKEELTQGKSKHELDFQANSFGFPELPWNSEIRVNGKGWLYPGMAAAWETIFELFLNH